MRPLEFLAAHGVLAVEGVVYVEIAMVIFLTVFCGIALWVILARPGRFRDESRIPLDEKNSVTGDSAEEENDHVRA